MNDLFPFQDEGADYLADRDRALLADQMGLGKTPQAVIAAHRVGARSVLVLCKAVAKRMWQNEWLRWSPDSGQWVVRLPRPGERICVPRVIPPTGPGYVCIVNYDIVHDKTILAQLVCERRWDVVICDEMHMLKSASNFYSRDPDERVLVSRRAQAVLHPEKGVWTHCGHVWGLSGTPAPNHVGELYGWLRMQMGRGPEQDYEGFLDKYTRWGNSPYGKRVYGNRDIPQLRSMLRASMLRRMRKDVLPDLPDLRIDTLTLTADKIPSELSALEGHADITQVRTLLKALGPEDDPEAAIEVADTHMGTLRRLTGLAKVEPTAFMVEDMLANGTEAIVLMAWHRDTITKLAELLEPYGVITVHGGSPAKEKELAESRFQDYDDCRVFVGQIQTAGTSITLTRANRLLIVEPSWSPDEHEQAILRIMRIGQRNACHASFVALAESTDELVMDVYMRKARNLSEAMD